MNSYKGPADAARSKSRVLMSLAAQSERQQIVGEASSYEGWGVELFLHPVGYCHIGIGDFWKFSLQFTHHEYYKNYKQVN